MNNSILYRRIREEEEWIENNGWEGDSYEELLSQCGMTRDGGCMYAGSEYCDWDCPFDSFDLMEEDPSPYDPADPDWINEDEESKIYDSDQLNLFKPEE